MRLPHQWMPKARMEAVSPLGVPFEFVPHPESRPCGTLEIRVHSMKGTPGKTSTNADKPVPCRVVGKEVSASETTEETEESEDVGSLARCRVCNDGGDDESMLLCDVCDNGFHIYCLSPPLAAIPEGEWHCSECSKNMPEWARFKVNDR